MWTAHDIEKVTLRKSSDDIPCVRKADLENHNKDGGHWIVVEGKVYDVQDFNNHEPGGLGDLTSEPTGLWTFNVIMF